MSRASASPRRIDEEELEHTGSPHANYPRSQNDSKHQDRANLHTPFAQVNLLQACLLHDVNAFVRQLPYSTVHYIANAELDEAEDGYISQFMEREWTGRSLRSDLVEVCRCTCNTIKYKPWQGQRITTIDTAAKVPNFNAQLESRPFCHVATMQAMPCVKHGSPKEALA